jgi:hypothetical protein
MSETNLETASPWVLLNGPFTSGEVGCPNPKPVAGSGSLGLGLDEPNSAIEIGTALGSGSSGDV